MQQPVLPLLPQGYCHCTAHARLNQTRPCPSGSTGTQAVPVELLCQHAVLTSATLHPKCCQPVAQDERSKCPHCANLKGASFQAPPDVTAQQATPSHAHRHVLFSSRHAATWPAQRLGLPSMSQFANLLNSPLVPGRNGIRNNCASQRTSRAICPARPCHPQSSACPGK